MRKSPCMKIVALCCCMRLVLMVDCPYKECICSEDIIECTGITQERMPLIVGSNIPHFLSLALEGNQISIIPTGSMPPGISNIDIQNTPVTTIEDTAFDVFAGTLKTLDLTNTSFIKIPNAFGHLRVLSYFHLSNNNIKDWNPEAMGNISKNLESLELINDGMTTWPTWLLSFSQLTELTVSGNTISSIPDDAFDEMFDKLEILFLNDNHLTSVPKVISKLTNLQNLYLQNNRISDVSFLPQTSKLVLLSLSDNNIANADQLSQAARIFGSSLLTLDITKNLLTSIPDFSPLTQINFLNLTNNRISDPYSGSAQPNLYSLDLSHNLLQAVPQIYAHLLNVTEIGLSWNSIQTIQATDFHLLTRLLDLAYNLITVLTDSSFPVNSSIMFLYLNNNPLTTITDGALRKLLNLEELSLQSTKITSLPLGLRHLINLRTLDVSNIHGLVCTCLEKDLTAWIKTIERPDHVIGECGLTSVYNFFNTLSSSCP